MHTDAPSPAPDQKKRWIARHPGRFALLALSGAVLLGAGYAGYETWRMADNLLQVRDAAPAIAEAAASGDIGALDTALQSMQQPAQQANAHADNWSVKMLAALPVIGGDIEAVRSVAYATDLLATAAPSALAALPDLEGEGLAGLTSERYAELDRAITELRASTGDAHARLKQVDADTLRVSQLREQLPQLTTALAEMQSGLDRAQPLFGALPLITSPDDTRTWLVINQNLTEARGSGGLLSAYAVLRADHGEIELLDQGSNDDLIASGPADASSAPEDLQDFWGDELTTWWGLNESAHFPTNARIIVDGWNQNNKQQVDGVLTLGQGTMQYLAAAAGPIPARDKTIEPEQLADYLTVGLYRDHPNPKTKDKVAAEIVSELFGRIASGDLDISRLMRTAFTAENPDYMQMWSTHDEDMDRIVSAGLSGALPASQGPVTSVRAVNASGNKLEAFLQLDVSYELGACILEEDTPTSRESRMTVHVTNNAPTEGLPEYMTGRNELPGGAEYTVGSTRELILLYPPVDAIEQELLLDGEQTGAAYGYERNREFAAIPVDVAPGETRIISARWVEPAEDDETGEALSGQPRVIMPPLINQPTIHTPKAKTCAPVSGS